MNGIKGWTNNPGLKGGGVARQRESRERYRVGEGESTWREPDSGTFQDTKLKVEQLIFSSGESKKGVDTGK